MILPRTLFTYFLKEYFRCFALVCFILSLLLFLSTIFDTLYRFKQVSVPFALFLKLSLLKIPYLLKEIFALINLISAMLFFRKIIQSKELIVILSSGISVYKVIFSLSLACFLISTVFLLGISPISSLCMKTHARLERDIRNFPKNSTVDLMDGGGIIITENYDKEKRIVIAKNISLSSAIIKQTTVLFTDLSNNFIKRIDSESISLEKHGMLLAQNSVIYDGQSSSPIKKDVVLIPTRLIINDFAKSSIPPEHLSIFQLPPFIKKLSELGMCFDNYKIAFFKQLYQPLYVVATLLLPFCFLRIGSRDNLSWKNLSLGLILGFGFHTIKEFSTFSLIAHSIPIYISILAPIIFLILFSLIIILHIYK